MRNNLFGFILTLLAIAGFLSPETARASNAAAGQLMYQWVSGSTYDLYVAFYRECSATPEPASVTVCYTNTCNSFQGTVTLNKISGNLPPTVCGSGALNTQISTGCPQSVTTCQNPASTLPGYKEFWYAARVTLPMQCNFWRFAASLGARNAAITNLANPASSALHLETTLYSAAGTGENPGNTSPCFTVKPILYINVNRPTTFNMGATDADNDSLTYELIMPRSQGSGCNGVNMAFSQPQFGLPNNPLATGNTFSLDGATGQINFVSLQPQVANIAVLVKEYQNGILRGTTVREIQIVALSGNSAPPQPLLPTTISGGQVVNGRYEGYAGQRLQFCFPVRSSDTIARLTGTDNHNNPPPGTSPVAPGALLVYNNVYTDSLNVCFSWTPTLSDTGLHTIIITVQDTVCHPSGYPSQTTFALPIYIHPPTGVQTPISGNQIRLFPNPAGNFVTIQNTAAHSMKTIRILDVAGALISDIKVSNGNEQRLDISRLATGTYLIRMELEGGAIVVRRLQIGR